MYKKITTEEREMYRDCTNVYYEVETVKSYKNNPNQIKFKKHSKFTGNDNVVVLFEEDFYTLLDDIKPTTEISKSADNDNFNSIKEEYVAKVETLQDLLNKADNEKVQIEYKVKLLEVALDNVPVLVENILNSVTVAISEDVTKSNNEQFKQMGIISKLRNKEVKSPLIENKELVKKQLDYLVKELENNKIKLLE